MPPKEQEVFFEVGEVMPSPESANPRVAFGRFLKSELYDMFGEHDLDVLTTEELAWMTPRNLAKNLFGRSRDDMSSVDGVALNGYEYKLVARSPKKLAETAFTNTIATGDVSEEMLARGNRSGVHALNGKLPKMVMHRESLRQRRTDIKTLIRHAEMPGFAHKTDKAMRQLFNQTWSEFVTVLDAVHIQREWTDEQRNKAESALIAYLTTGPQRTRTRNWKQMMNLSTNYIDNRVGIFTRKINATVKEIEVLSPNVVEQTI